MWRLTRDEISPAAVMSPCACYRWTTWVSASAHCETATGREGNPRHPRHSLHPPHAKGGEEWQQWEKVVENDCQNRSNSTYLVLPWQKTSQL
jgi:hypothetical protein